MVMAMISKIGKIGGTRMISKIGKAIDGIKIMVSSKLMMSLLVVGLVLEEAGLEIGTANIFTSLTALRTNEKHVWDHDCLFFRLELLVYVYIFSLCTCESGTAASCLKQCAWIL